VGVVAVSRIEEALAGDAVGIILDPLIAGRAERLDQADMPLFQVLDAAPDELRTFLGGAGAEVVAVDQAVR
jgi:hypothetical protein